jgi:N-methylhydantoinase A
MNMGEVVFFAHGSTIATNTLVERKLAKTGLLTTKGFRDVLELRRGNRDELWDFYHEVAPAPVRRRDRLEVEERIDFRWTNQERTLVQWRPSKQKRGFPSMRKCQGVTLSFMTLMFSQIQSAQIRSSSKESSTLTIGSSRRRF